MAKKNRNKHRAAAPKPAAKKRPLAAAASAGPKGRPAGNGIGLDSVLAAWANRLGVQAYTARQWGQLAMLASGLCVVLLYAFSAGGFFVVRRGYGELIIFWLIVVGLLFELKARGRMPRLGKVELGLFAGYALWILLSVFWSVIPAKSLDEFVRAILYLGGFGLVYLFMSRREWLGWLGHLFMAIVAIVAIDALLGKTFPDLIDHPDPFFSNRINYPITYWNSMALFMVMGFLIGVRALSDRATHIAVRAVYAPALFLFLLVLWFTFSRTGYLLLAAVFCLYLYLAASRLRAVMQAALLGVWTAAVAGVSYLFLPNMIATVPVEALKVSEGHKLAIVIVLFMAVAAASQLVIRRLEARITVSPEMGRKIGCAIAGGLAICLAAAFLVLTFTGGRGGPVTFVQNQLGGLSGPSKAVDKPTERLFSLKSERFQEYGASLKRFTEAPLQGSGAGTWSAAWLKYRPWEIHVKDGHSWFFETVAELGLVGTLLLTGFIALFFVTSVRDLRFLGRGRDRELYAAFFAASTAFLLHAMIDWDWEMPVVTLPFFMFAGGLLRFGELARTRAQEKALPAAPSPGKAGLRRFLGMDLLWGSACVVAMALTIVPLVAQAKLQMAGQLSMGSRPDYAALERAAASAGAWGPLDAEPLILQAMARQAQGKPEDAERLLMEARAKEPENEKIFRALTRLYLQEYEDAGERGDAARQKELVGKAADVFTQAHELDPMESEQGIPLYDQLRKVGAELPFARPTPKKL